MSFTGLSAFPLTPMDETAVDEAAFARLVERLAAAGVDSIGALGSTGSYAYLDRAERARVARLAVRHAGTVPVIVGIGALRTRDVLALAEDAQRAGARGVLLAPVSYQKLTEGEVFGLYEAVSRTLSVPLVVYDNPGTTGFTFTDALHGRIAQLPNVGSIKVPPVSGPERVAALRSLLPAHVTIGVSGDAWGAAGLAAGCDGWYSAVGGLFPEAMLAIARAPDPAEAQRRSERLAPLWELIARHGGSIRVLATAAELLGLAGGPGLPAPLRPLAGTERERLAALIGELGLR